MAPKKDEEDPYTKNLDLCLTDGIIKTGGGALVGAVASLLFLRRRRWPVITGFGMGAGIAYANCEHSLNTHLNRVTTQKQ